MFKKIIRSSLHLGISTTARYLYWVFSGNVISIILTFFTLIIVIANHISKADYGIFLALFTLANLLSDLGEAGLGSSLSSFIPQLVIQKKEAEAQDYMSAAFWVEVLIGLVFLVCLIVLSPFLARVLFANTQPINVVITAIMTASMVLFGFSIFSLSAYKKFPEVSVVTIAYNLIRLGLLVLIVFVSKLALPSILVVYTVASFGAWVYSLLFLKTGFMKQVGSSQKRRTLLHFSSFLALQKIFISISSRLDILMLVPLGGAVEAAVYGVASRFSLVYPVLIGSLGQVLAPKFAEFGKGKDALGFFKKVGLVILLLLFSQIVFYFISRPLIALLVPKYTEAVPVFQWLLIAMTGFIAATPFVSFLIYTLKKPHITTLSSLVQLIIIFVANVYFVPRYGRFGPAIGIGLGNLAILFISASATWYYLKKET